MTGEKKEKETGVGSHLVRLLVIVSSRSCYCLWLVIREKKEGGKKSSTNSGGNTVDFNKQALTRKLQQLHTYAYIYTYTHTCIYTHILMYKHMFRQIHI